MDQKYADRFNTALCAPQDYSGIGVVLLSLPAPPEVASLF
jgi:hypothetical protein